MPSYSSRYRPKTIANKGTHLLILICLFFFFRYPPSLSADFVPAAYNDPESISQHRIAVGLVIGTVIALVGGVAYAASISGRNSHCSSSSSSSLLKKEIKIDEELNLMDVRNRTRTTNNDTILVTSSFPSSYYGIDNTNVFEDNVTDGFNDFVDLDIGESIFVDIGDPLLDNPNAFARGENLINPIRAKALSGSIVTLSSMPSIAQGSLTVFVQLPDGSTKVLGNLPLSKETGVSLPYGPFHQKGTYRFGMIVDKGTKINAKAKIASVNININGSMEDSLEFNLPANPPENYEPPIQSYHFF